MDGKPMTPVDVAREQLMRERRARQEARVEGEEMSRERQVLTPEIENQPGKPVTTESVIAAQHARTQLEKRGGYIPLTPKDEIRQSFSGRIGLRDRLMPKE